MTFDSNRDIVLPDATHTRFERLCEGIGVDEGIASNAWEKLAAHYSENHRHYHNLTHIGGMLGHLDRVAPGDGTLELAIWFHDAIYDPSASNNEIQSAALFTEYLGTRLHSSLTDDVERLILATDPKLTRSGQDDENLLIDIDLSILGATADEYDRYRLAIRKEYSIVPEAAFKNGRIAVLEKILSGRIFATPAFTGLEPQARSNLGREIDLLRS